MFVVTFLALRDCVESQDVVHCLTLFLTVGLDCVWLLGCCMVADRYCIVVDIVSYPRCVPLVLSTGSIL
jgi:hypothetical protein